MLQIFRIHLRLITCILASLILCSVRAKEPWENPDKSPDLISPYDESWPSASEYDHPEIRNRPKREWSPSSIEDIIRKSRSTSSSDSWYKSPEISKPASKTQFDSLREPRSVPSSNSWYPSPVPSPSDKPSTEIDSLRKPRSLSPSTSSWYTSSPPVVSSSKFDASFERKSRSISPKDSWYKSPASTSSQFDSLRKPRSLSSDNPWLRSSSNSLSGRTKYNPFRKSRYSSINRIPGFGSSDRFLRSKWGSPQTRSPNSFFNRPFSPGGANSLIDATMKLTRQVQRIADFLEKR